MTALRKHSVWSSVAIDVIMGNVFGMVVLSAIEYVYSGTLFIAQNITDNLLNSRCVRLMGVPAGFKLNRELAELLGMVSLNAIQILSTLWFFLGFLWWHYIKGLVFSGIILGLTVPAVLCYHFILEALKFNPKSLEVSKKIKRLTQLAIEKKQA
ncbi:uncharacterized protein A4U43_UnF11750 [Asparagus officinalis]|uniref:Uncharacterized protein n=1 Tax=Asparagus officinalis TaxID=4686 RepID=A0A1R3L577_ASPOF|nr:uncharacterized protein A4U43_UnF11750 [Asparagus officinalis]